MTDEIFQPKEIGAKTPGAHPGGTVEPPKTVVPWDARQAGQIGREPMRVLTPLHEAFARNLTHAFGAYLRVVFEAGLVSAEYLTYRDYLQRLPEVSYLCSCNLVPMEVASLLQLDLSIAFPLIDLLLGGEGKGALDPREVTEIEEQVLESVVQIVCRQLGVAWQAMGLEFHFDRRQQTANALRVMSPDDKVLALTFSINLLETRGNLRIAIPATVSAALLRKVSTEGAYRKPEGRNGSKEQLKARLLHCPVPVELGVLGIRVAAEELMAIKPGALLMLRKAVSSPATLLVGDQPVFQAVVMRHECRRVARLIGPVAKPAPAGKDAR